MKPQVIKKDFLSKSISNYLRDNKTEGLAFIGDPHVWSGRPGKRRDESFVDTIIGKLEFIAQVCNERNLQPVILGDFFHEEDDNVINMLVRVSLVLQKFDRKPITLTGNHEKEEWILKENDVLYLLKVSGLIDVIDYNGFWGKIELTSKTGKKHNVALGGTPYGQTIPYDLTEFLDINIKGGKSFRPEEDKQAWEKTKNNAKLVSSRGSSPVLMEANANNEILENRQVSVAIYDKLDVDDVVWLTHHDLAFDGAYPNSLPLHNIDGVSLLVNGHIHGTKKPVLVGQTAHYNPGNITRLSIDMAEHIPSFWVWTPFDNPGMASSNGLRVPLLERVVIPHVAGKDIFNFEGRHGRASLLDDIPESELLDKSLFVDLLQKDIQVQRTDDGVYLKESLLRCYDEYNTKPTTQAIVNDLLKRVLTDK